MAYSIVHESWLTKFVSNFGDSALIKISGAIYTSGMFKVAVLLSATLALVSLAWGIHNRQFSKKTLYFFMAFAFLTSSNGKPFGYIIVNTVSQTVAVILEKSVNSLVSNDAKHSGRNNLPPGAVLEMITSAVSSKIENPATRSLIYGFVMNCLPNALTNDGEKATFDDLFDFETQYKTEFSTGQTKPSFFDRKLDRRALANDNAYSSFRPGRNCEQGLSDMREALTADLNKQSLILTDRVVEGKKGHTGNELTTEPWFKNWEKSESQLKNLAMNLRIAHAAAYEQSEIVKDAGRDFWNMSGERWQGTMTDLSLRELMIGTGSETAQLGYIFSDFKNALSNSMRNRWAFTLGASIKDLKERIELVPYHVAAIQLFLKIVCPLFLLTLLFQTFRFFFIWSGAWFAALLMPSIISSTRAIHNSILLSKLGIENFLDRASGNKALAYGVDLSIAKNLTEDFIPLAYSMIEQELNLIKLLSGVLLIGSWLAGGGANGFVSWLSNSVQGLLTSRGLAGAASLAGKTVSRVGAVAKKGSGGAITVSNSAMQSIMQSIRNPKDGFETSFSRMFRRRT